MSDGNSIQTKRWLFLALILAVWAAVLGIILALIRRQRQQARLLDSAPDLQQFQGLTEEEAEARRPPSTSEERELEAKQVRRDIWRSSTFSIFNFSMLGLTVAQTLLGDALSALLTFAVFLLNIAFTAAQQLYATNKVEGLLDATQPHPTAIRDGRIRSVNIDEIVVGDVLVAGPGDEFLTDGELLSGRPEVVESIPISGESRTNYKAIGDQIQAGSYCVGGRAVYVVTTLADELGSQRWTPVQDKAELTPLQRIMARVLRLMFAFIAFFLVILVLDMLSLPILSNLLEADYRETASIFFSIAPNSLFFMIVATYALGSARLGESGALIRDSRSVESLAQISVLCFSKTGVLTGAQVRVEMMPLEYGQPALAESRVRQILGDMAHSTTHDNVFFQALAENFAGGNRSVEQAAWLLSAYGWSAATFTETDLRGTFVIGEPDILQPHLVGDEAPAEDSEVIEEGETGVRGVVGRLGRLFRRNGQESNDEEAAENGLEAETSEENTSSNAMNTSEDDDSGSPETRGGNLFQRLQISMKSIVRSTQDGGEGEVIWGEEPARSQPQLLFAYTPEPQSLYSADGVQQLPDDLIPLCNLTFEEQIHPEAREAVTAFIDSGVSVRILSSDEPEKVLKAAEELGLSGIEGAPLAAVSGAELIQMNEREFEESIQNTVVFGRLTAEQKGEIVRTLRRLDERVAMVGDGVDDLAGLEEANLRLTLRGSSQAALQSADIVLLEDTLQVLPTVLKNGQRIVNGLLDILKINLVQIGYILLLILVMLVTNQRIFFYHPTQGGVVAFFTIIIPSLGLTFWASTGAVPRQYMRSRLFHFVVPGAVTMAAAALVISWIFGRGLVDIAYSQLAVAQGLVLMGLLLIVFVQPPTRFWVGGDVLSGDWRNTYMAIVLLIVFIAATYIPLTQELLRLDSLQRARDYFVILAIAVAWVFIVRAIWRAPWLSRYVGILSDRLEK